MKWCNLLRVKSEFPINLWPNAVQAYHHWIRASIRQGMPYDRCARELSTVRIEVGPQVFAGRRELRLVTSNGLSNPLSFLVDARPEVTKPDSKSIPEARGSLNARIDARPLPRNVVLPSILNGQIPPGCVDRYSFAAKTGQKLVVLVQARQLIPYIADAAPGWFQATVTLSDAAGTSLAANDDFDDRGSGLKTHDADSANAQGASLVGGFLAGKPISARARVHAVASPLQCHGARLRQLVEPRGRGRGPGAAPPLRLGHREHRSGGRERVPGRTRRLDRPVDDLPRRPAFRDRTRGCETR